MNRFDSRSIFITGCSSGIGRAAALLFARRGHRITATARNVSALEDLKREAAADGLDLHTTECDVTREETMRVAVATAEERWNGLDVLVNNAGYGLVGAVEAVPLDDARKLLEANTFGAVRLIQLVLPGMRARKRGRIINVSSIGGRIVIPYASWYSASKFALEAISDGLRLELEPFGIRTVSVLPGPVGTRFMGNVAAPPLLSGGPRQYEMLSHIYASRRVTRRKFEITAEAVAEVICRAATARRPRARYYLTLPARAAAILDRLLPERAMDELLRIFYGLRSIPYETD